MKEKIKKAFAGIGAFTKKHGTYFMLMLCLIVVAVAVAFIFPTSYDDKENEEGAVNTPVQTPQEGAAVSGGNDEHIGDKSSFEPDNEAESVFTGDIHAGRLEKNTPVPQNTPQNTEKNALLSPPLQGGITWAYAMDMLTYSKTLDQWTTHAGVDIEADLGAKVRAVRDGTVASVYEDSGLGITVVIEHSDGHKTVYANLAKDSSLVSEGQAVKANTVIGVVGETATFECAEKSHLHFEYHVKGVPSDPTKYVLFVGA